MHLGAYEVTGEIARGGMGVVLRGRAPDGRDVAIKLALKRESEEARARFARERQLLSVLGESEGMVPLLDVGSHDGATFLVMPFLGGGDLRRRLDKGPLGIDEAVSLVQELAAAVGRAHGKGIVHRDLKPENVLFSADGRAFVSDLGLAKYFRIDGERIDGASLSRTGTTSGTFGYMAPEQGRSAKHVGPPADVFALGAILYECLAARPAFTGKSAMSLMAAVEQEEPPPLSEARPDTPRWLQGVVAKALAKNPTARYPDATALAKALAERRAPSAPLARAIAALFVVAALVGGAAVAVHAKRGSEPVAPPPLAGPAGPSPPRAPPAPATGGPPAWFQALPEALRPRLPLPVGLSFGEAAGDYVWARDGSVLVYCPQGVHDLELVSTGFKVDAPEKLSGTVPPFFIGKLEVTHAQFARYAKTRRRAPDAQRACFRDSGSSKGPQFESDRTATFLAPQGAGSQAQDDLPAVQVTWEEAETYCAWAGLQLPTHVQWYVAATWDPATRTHRKYPWGDEARPGGKAAANDFAALPRRWLKGETDPPGKWPRAAPGGSFPLDRSPCGAYDLAGNVTEWVRDATAESDGRFWVGAGWERPVDQNPLTRRAMLRPEFASDTIGFRVVYSLRR